MIGAVSYLQWKDGSDEMCVWDFLPTVWSRVTAVMDWIVLHTKGEKPAPKNSKCEDIYYEDYCVVLDDALIPYP